MSAGMVVLSTRKAEATRYFIRHSINGRIIDKSYTGLIDGMVHCLENKRDLIGLSKQAKSKNLKRVDWMSLVFLS